MLLQVELAITVASLNLTENKAPQHPLQQEIKINEINTLLLLSLENAIPSQTKATSQCDHETLIVHQNIYYFYKAIKEKNKLYLSLWALLQLNATTQTL